MALFGNRTASTRRKDAAMHLMMQARAILRADHDGSVVSVSEHDCGDPGCSSARTVVLVMRQDQPTKAVKIDKPLECVRTSDLVAALAPIVAPGESAEPGQVRA
jgi:hypothetical protein